MFLVANVNTGVNVVPVLGIMVGALFPLLGYPIPSGWPFRRDDK